MNVFPYVLTRLNSCILIHNAPTHGFGRDGHHPVTNKRDRGSGRRRLFFRALRSPGSVSHSGTLRTGKEIYSRDVPIF